MAALMAEAGLDVERIATDPGGVRRRTRTSRAPRCPGRRCRSSSGGCRGRGPGRGSCSSATSMSCRSAIRAPGRTTRSAAAVRDGRLFGRGACDMKGGVAVDPGRAPGDRRDRRRGTARGRRAVRERALGGGWRPGDARGDPGRLHGRHGDHHRADRPRGRHRPCRRDHVPTRRPGPGGPRVAADGGRLRARQAGLSRGGPGGRRGTAQRGRDGSAHDRARPAVPHDRRHGPRRATGRRRSSTGSSPRAATASGSARPPARPRPSCGLVIEAACAADPFLRDHPATVEITGGRFSSSRIAADHPLPVGLAGAVEAVTGPPPWTHRRAVRRRHAAARQRGGDADRHLRAGRCPGRPRGERVGAARRGRDVRPRAGRLARADARAAA